MAKNKESEASKEKVREKLNDRLVKITREIAQQDQDKKDMAAGFTSAIKQLRRQQAHIAEMLHTNHWYEEDLVQVGVSAPPLDGKMLNSEYQDQ